MDYAERGKDTGCRYLGFKKALLSIVTVLKRAKIETSPKVETHLSNRLFLQFRGAAGQVTDAHCIQCWNTVIAQWEKLIWQLWISTQFRDRLSCPPLDWTLLFCSHNYLLYVLRMLSTICFLPSMSKYILIFAPVLIFLGWLNMLIPNTGQEKPRRLEGHFCAARRVDTFPSASVETVMLGKEQWAICQHIPNVIDK